MNFDGDNGYEDLKPRELEEQQIPTATFEEERPQCARRRPA